MSNHSDDGPFFSLTMHQQLLAAVVTAQQVLIQAEAALDEWQNRTENHVYPTIEQACTVLEGRLYSQASAACEGSYNLGLDEYTQEFIVDGVHYLATLACEYNRHDKQYYYVDGRSFTYKQV